MLTMHEIKLPGVFKPMLDFAIKCFEKSTKQAASHGLTVLRDVINN